MMTFEQWFSQRYPKLREAAEFGMLGGNELWLYEVAKEAFKAGQLNSSTDDGDQPIDP